jgi:hypothetical protein
VVAAVGDITQPCIIAAARFSPGRREYLPGSTPLFGVLAVGRLYTLLLGMVIGFALCMVVYTYHVVHARDGLHLVAKVPSRLDDPYVDLRSLRAGELQPNLVEALRRAKLEHLLVDELQQRVGDKMNELLQGPAPPQ